MAPAAPGSEGTAIADGNPLPSLKPLCDQQFWLFGCDVRRRRGNLLIAAGFERLRLGGGRPTRYSRSECRLQIALWGFGMLWIPRGRPAVFLGRGGRLVASGLRTVPKVGDATRAARRLRLRGPADLYVAAQAMYWIAGYESWLGETAGLGHREEALAGAGRCPEAADLSALWVRQADRLLPQDDIRGPDASGERHRPGAPSELFVDCDSLSLLPERLTEPY